MQTTIRDLGDGRPHVERMFIWILSRTKPTAIFGPARRSVCSDPDLTLFNLARLGESRVEGFHLTLTCEEPIHVTSQERATGD